MRTRCPHCNTLYELDARVLEMTNGLATCFKCKRAFRASDHEVEDTYSGLAPAVEIEKDLEEPEFIDPNTNPDEPSMPLLADDETALESTHDESSPAEGEPAFIESAQADEPEFIEEQEIDDLRFDFSDPMEGIVATESTGSAGNGSTPSRLPPGFKPPAHELEVPDNLPPLRPTPVQENPFAHSREKPGSQSHRTLKTLVILLLICLAIAQLAWLNRERLLSDPRVYSAINSVCARLNCTLPPMRAPGEIEVINRSLRPDPENAGALLLRLQIRNAALHPQPVPDLQLTLRDFNNHVIARRLFAAATYRLDQYSLSPGENTSISLSIRDPGWQAAGFSIDFY